MAETSICAEQEEKTFKAQYTETIHTHTHVLCISIHSKTCNSLLTRTCGLFSKPFPMHIMQFQDWCFTIIHVLFSTYEIWI